MKGIYKISTPSNKVYIGQSVNIKKRFADHRWPNKRTVSLLARSVKKYGYSAHKFEVIHELPNDVSKTVLSVYESLYMDLYRSCGVHLLNISDAKESNYGYKKTQETIEKHRAKLIGRSGHRKGTTHTDEAKAVIKAKRALQTNVGGPSVAWNKGMKFPNQKGRPHTEETKEKLRQISTGKKLSPETIAKRTATLKANKANKKSP